MRTKIPTGTSKEAIERRKEIIRSGLAKLKGKTVKCPCLGNVPVHIDQKSIDEIADKAGLSPASTKLALKLKHLIHEARFVRMTLPKGNSMQKKKFQLIFMYELQAETTDGTIVLVVKGAKSSMVTYIKLELATENYWRVKSAHIRKTNELYGPRFKLIWEKGETKKPAKRKR